MDKLPVTAHSQESGGKELNSDSSGRPLQLSHSQQEQQQLEQNPESPVNEEQKDNQESLTMPQIQLQLCSGQAQDVQLLQKHQNQESSTLPQIQQQSCSGQAQEVHQLQKHQSHTLHPVVSKEVQIIESKIQQNQDPQYQKNQKPQTDESQELQTQQLQAQTLSSQLLQCQQTFNPVQVTQPLSTSEESQQKQSTEHQKQAKNYQYPAKGSQEWHQQQLKQQKKQLEKLSRKLDEENPERRNYLVQASKAVALTARPGSSTAFHSQRTLAAQIGSLAGVVSRRLVLLLAPALKRCLCKGCGTALVYGVNAKVRHRSRRQKHLVVTCLTCYTIKRFVNNPRHQLWCEKEEAVVPQESGRMKLKSELSGRHLQLSHSQQEQQQLEQNPESAINEEQKDNQESSALSQIEQHLRLGQAQEVQRLQKHQIQESSTLPQIQQQFCSGQAQEVQWLQKHQIQESSTLPQIQQQLFSGQAQEVQQLLKCQSHTLHPVVSKEVQITESKIQQNQDPQYQENQKPQTDVSQELQTQQLQAQTLSSQLLLSQQTSNPVQVTQPLSAREESKHKQSTEHQKQAKKRQHPEKGSQQLHQQKRYRTPKEELKKQRGKLNRKNSLHLDYLDQASNAFALTARLESSTDIHSQRALPAQLGSLAGAVSYRCVLRLDPALKHYLCKGCGTALVFGVNATVKNRTFKYRRPIVTCLTCHTYKFLSYNPTHQFWFEKENEVIPPKLEKKKRKSGRHLQLSYSQQEQQQLEQNPESPVNEKQKDNQESSTLPQIQQQLCSGQAQEVQQLQKHQSHTLHPVVSKEVQITESKIQQNQDPQYQENQKPQTDESRELQTQQLQTQTHSSQLLLSQQTSNPVQVTQLLSAREESQQKQSTEHQKQAKNCQHPEEGSQEWQQLRKQKRQLRRQKRQLKKQEMELIRRNQAWEQLKYLVQPSEAIALTTNSTSRARNGCQKK